MYSYKDTYKDTHQDTDKDTKDTALLRLRNSCGRYLLFTGLGSYLLLSSFSWSAETSFLGAAGLGILLELLIETLFKSPRNRYPETSEQISSRPSRVSQTPPINLQKQTLQKQTRQHHD